MMETSKGVDGNDMVIGNDVRVKFLSKVVKFSWVIKRGRVGVANKRVSQPTNNEMSGEQGDD
jgi:hypothetical protein